jgi:hypothetical protein
MKCWCTAPDGSIKASNLVTSAKELLRRRAAAAAAAAAAAVNMSQCRMLALVDPNPHNDINRNRSQCVYVLEGREQVIGANASPSSTAGNVPPNCTRRCSSRQDSRANALQQPTDARDGHAG